MPITVYKSSAGSGKTYTLVSEYLRLLIHQPSEFRNILAITFTNKATAEMKSRIVSALAKVSRGEFADLEEKLLQEVYGGQIKTEEDIQFYRSVLRENARKALTNILHSYSEFNVSTIDSFFQQILRNFSKELKLPMRYEIEMDTAYALDELVTQLMQDVGHDKELTKWLEEFAFSQVDEDKGWDIAQSITHLGMEIFREEVWANLNLTDSDNEGMTVDTDAENGEKTEQESRELRNVHYAFLKNLIGELWKIKQHFEQKMDAFGKEAQELAAGYNLSEKDFKTGTFAFFKKIRLREFETGVTLQKIIEGNTSEWTVKTSANKQKVEQLVNQGGLQTLLLETVDYMNTHFRTYRSAIEVLKNIYVYGILHDLKAKLRTYRSEKNLMLVSDTNNVLRAIISHEDDAPFIYEKVGTVYKHLLIDEFQDTSNFQWDNLLPLVKNSLGNNDTVLIVGDVKQSIYRWRGGDSKQLLYGLKTALGLFFTEKTEKELAYNYRSAQNIVTFNNAFFETAVQLLTGAESQVSDQNLLKNAYASVSQGIKRTSAGYVKAEFCSANSGNDDEGSWKQISLKKLLNTINELESRQCPWRNMAVLVRSNAEGSEIARFLSANDKRVVSSESLLLKGSVKVQLLISVLHYLANPNNDIAKTEILVNYLAIHHPDISLTDEVFSDHLKDGKESLFDRILQPTGFKQKTEELVKKPLYETVELLLKVLNLDLLPDAYIQRFQDLILEFSRTKSADIFHFLEWWQENKERDKTSIIVPEGENAITIMTIHKAKGLEFPVVFVPYADWNMKPKDVFLWTKLDMPPFDSLGTIPMQWTSALEKTHFAEYYATELINSYLDNLNLLYVALTRPTEELYLFSKTAKNMDNKVDGIYKLLYNTFANFALSNDFNPDTLIFEFGQPTDWTKISANKQEEIVPLTRYLTNEYHSKITLRSDSKRFFTLFDNTKSKAIKLGQKIHRLLEKLNSPNDIDKEFRKLQVQGLLSAEDEVPVKERLKKIFAIPQVKDWFDAQWEVFSERSLLCDELRRIPDRVIVKNKEAIVIDYKTGTPHQKHHQQLKGYVQWLQDMGYTVTGQYLLYIFENEAEVVPVL
ncbi:MAG: UvrD-helicase domain-containing protein [Sphingobacteriales bacterium]|nr:MAG: UvrD-helicase domain-containing protein [Sphingobacteriales bacterium]